jgi:hypothetical protein
MMDFVYSTPSVLLHLQLMTDTNIHEARFCFNFTFTRFCFLSSPFLASPDSSPSFFHPYKQPWMSDDNDDFLDRLA